MLQVPKGKVTTINEIRKTLAKKHGATIACPITTGIFAWVSANAAEEAYASGVKDITPWWRTLKTGGELNPKYPGGTAEQEARLKAEGHTIVPGKGKKPPVVKDYEKKLVEG
jgi:alkylated DNA nucleotide flippase Atl1